jgi:predicted ATPase
VTLTHYLKAKQALLVIDNCEHLIAGCARLAETLLTACVQLQILATSREPLNLSGEMLFHVPLLKFPDPQYLPALNIAAQYESVRLFVARARAVHSEFQLTEANLASVAQICSRLDGIPLALELAAARVKLLSVEHIAARLDDRFKLLTGGSRTALPRQQTLRATIDWSYDLLPKPAQRLFRRLSVFVGGFTLEAAEQVCSDGRLERHRDALSDVGDDSRVCERQIGRTG